MSASYHARQQDVKAMLARLETHQFINERGFSDWYAMSNILSQCLFLDGKTSVHNPNPVCQLLLETAANTPESLDKIKKIPDPSIPKAQYHVYPNGEVVWVHISVWINHIHEYVQRVGETVIDKKWDKSDCYYAAWIEDEDLCTFLFFTQLFSEIRALARQIDKNKTLKSHLMNIHLSKGDDSRFSHLIDKQGIVREAYKRVETAISEKYYLEAITLQESIIADALAMVLFLKNAQPENLNLYKLIEKAKDLLGNERTEALHSWREQRNSALHTFVRRSPYVPQTDVTEFDRQTKETAIEGKNLVSSVDGWLESMVYDELNPYQLISRASRNRIGIQ